MKHTVTLAFCLFLCGLSSSLFAPFGYIPGAKSIIAMKRRRERRRKIVDTKQPNTKKAALQNKDSTDEKKTN